MNLRSVQSASSKSRDLVSVIPPSDFYVTGHTPPSSHLVFVPWLGYSQHLPPGSLPLASGHHSPRFLLGLVGSLSLTRHTFYHQPRDRLYMAPVLFPLSMVVFADVCSCGSLKAIAAERLPLVLLLQIWVFLVFHTVVFLPGFTVDAFCWLRVSCLFFVVFSAQALGAGFRQGVFSPMVSTASMMGSTGWKFVAAKTIAVTCYFCTSCFVLRPQLETKFQIGKKKDMGFGFFTQPSKFFHTLYFPYKIFIYHTFGNQDTTVLYVPIDRRW